jgi:hypothetical protein
MPRQVILPLNTTLKSQGYMFSSYGDASTAASKKLINISTYIGTILKVWGCYKEGWAGNAIKPIEAEIKKEAQQWIKSNASNLLIKQQRYMDIVNAVQSEIQLIISCGKMTKQDSTIADVFTDCVKVFFDKVGISEQYCAEQITRDIFNTSEELIFKLVKKLFPLDSIYSKINFVYFSKAPYVCYKISPTCANQIIFGNKTVSELRKIRDMKYFIQDAIIMGDLKPMPDNSHQQEEMLELKAVNLLAKSKIKNLKKSQ